MLFMISISSSLFQCHRPYSILILLCRIEKKFCPRQRIINVIALNLIKQIACPDLWPLSDGYSSLFDGSPSLSAASAFAPSAFEPVT